MACLLILAPSASRTGRSPSGPGTAAPPCAARSVPRTWRVELRDDPALNGLRRMFRAYQAIRCADGYIALGTANDRLCRRFCDLLGHSEWTTDPEFADNERRLGNHRALAERIEAVTSQRPRGLDRPLRRQQDPVRIDQTTTRRCSPIRTSSRATWRSRSNTRRSVGSSCWGRRSTERNTNQPSPSRADARRAH